MMTTMVLALKLMAKAGAMTQLSQAPPSVGRGTSNNLMNHTLAPCPGFNEQIFVSTTISSMFI